MLFLFSELQVFKEVNMRRAFILISAFLVFVLCLSSCDVNGGKPGEEQSGGGYEQFAVPSFLTSARTRGISADTVSGGNIANLPKQSKILQSFPIIPSLKLENIDTDSAEPLSSLDISEIKAFDIRLVMNEELSELKDDGLFLVYDVYDAEVLSARVEYYYNSGTKRFTYREYALCTFDLSNRGMGTNNMILLLELSDIPVEMKDDGTVSYNAGGLSADGDNEKNAIMDYIILSGSGSIATITDTSSIWRDYRIINNDDNIIASMSLPWFADHYDFDFQSTAPAELKSIIQETFSEHPVWDSSVMKTLGLEFAFRIMNQVYATEHDITPYWEDYDEFLNAGHREFKPWVTDIIPEKMVNEQPVIANLQTRDIAPDSGYGTFSSVYSLSHIQSGEYESCGMNKFFGEYTGSEDELLTFLAEKFCNKCGIKNENWIENFIYSLKTTYDDQSGKRFVIPVTTEDPATFKSEYDEALSLEGSAD